MRVTEVAAPKVVGGKRDRGSALLARELDGAAVGIDERRHALADASRTLEVRGRARPARAAARTRRAAVVRVDLDGSRRAESIARVFCSVRAGVGARARVAVAGRARIDAGLAGRHEEERRRDPAEHATDQARRAASHPMIFLHGGRAANDAASRCDMGCRMRPLDSMR